MLEYMPSERLPNYLRAQRKRAGFSQHEIAFLLGCRYGTKVSRYERFVREPTLKTALAYEIIFATPVRELFLGVFDKAERETQRRARHLVRHIERRRGRLVDQKLALLKSLTNPPPEDLSIEPIADL